MSLANRVGAQPDYEVVYNEAFAWSSSWVGVASLEEKAQAVVGIPDGILNALEPNADIQVLCVGTNTDGQGGSGTGSADLKRAATLPVVVRNVDYVNDRLQLVRPGLIAEVITSGGVGGAVQSDDVDGSAVYRVIISKPL